MSRMTFPRLILAALSLGLLLTGHAQAQSYTSAGQSWNTVFGFASASDRSVALQRAQAVRAAEQGTDQPVYNYNTYSDNRSNYIETNTSGGDVTGASQIGDQIGEETYSVGALNTGSTTITNNGSNNVITANNTATSSGCVDGSIIHSSTDTTGGTSAGGGTDAGYTQPYVTVTDSGTVTSDCLSK